MTTSGQESSFEFRPFQNLKCTYISIDFCIFNSPWIAPDIKHSSVKERFLAIGRIGTRYAFIAFAIRIKDHRKLIRPISARFMHKKEIKKYEEEIKKDNN